MPGRGAPTARPAVAGRAPSRTALLLVAICALAAAVRFATLEVQSLWLDESFTLALVRRPFGELLSALPRTERTPPPYVVAVWLWARPFGTSEAGLRSLSALAGTATIPLVFLAGRELVSRRAGLVAAALAAVHPWLVWYSQEARAYALLLLFATAGLVFFARALRADFSPRVLALWAVASLLTVTTHPAGAPIVIAEATWLVGSALMATERRGATVLAVGATAVGALVLIPLALAQSSAGSDVASGGGDPLATQVKQLTKQLFNSEIGGAFDGQALVAGIIAVAAVWLLVRRGDMRERNGALVAGSLAAAAAILPLAADATGVNAFLVRYALPAAVPALVVVAAGCGARRAGLAGLVAGVLLGAIWLATDVRVALDRGLQRDDWRGAVAALGPVREPRAVVVTHGYEELALEGYMHEPSALPPAGAELSELDVVRLARGSGEPPPLRFPGFALAARRRTTSYELLRFRAPGLARVTRATLAPVGPAPGVLVQTPP